MRKTRMKAVDLGCGDFEDFFLALQQEGRLSSKSIYNLRGHLDNFWAWLVKRREMTKEQVPEFPEVHYEMAMRKTVDAATREAILAEVLRQNKRNPRLYLAIRMCCTYVSVRPGEWLGVLEDDGDLERGLVVIRDHKTAKRTHSPKVVPLLEKDIEFMRGLPKGFPKMPFFRRDTGGGGRHAGSAFGKHLLYDKWKAACKVLGIEGVDLYGGTRHSNAQALREDLSAEDIKRLFGHSTTKAFNRYFEVSLDELRAGYALTRKAKRKPDNVLELRK